VNKKLDTSSKMGRIIFQMKDVSVRMKPDIRAIVIRIYNTVEANQEDTSLRFKLRDDLDKIGREPQLAGLARQLFKELPQT
jgi:2C-methyl-D-erythritol 2,4-cyclodiphosphate synthase